MWRGMLPEPTPLSRLSFGFLPKDTGSNVEVCHYSSYIQKVNRPLSYRSWVRQETKEGPKKMPFKRSRKKIIGPRGI